MEEIKRIVKQTHEDYKVFAKNIENIQNEGIGKLENVWNKVQSFSKKIIPKSIEDVNKHCTKDGKNMEQLFLDLVKSHTKQFKNMYEVDLHHIETQDGYILSCFRLENTEVSGQDTKPAVLLQHGLCDNSFSWVINGIENALAYQLADAGYQVYMNNTRMNGVSMKHKTFSRHSNYVWKFGFQHMAAFDIPAVVNYITETTGLETISYVGHSQGTTQMFANLCLKEEKRSVAAKINCYIALAPVLFVGKVNQIALKSMAKIKFDDLLLKTGLYIFSPTAEIQRKLVQPFMKNKLIKKGSVSFVDFFEGSTMDPEMLPVYTKYLGAPTSIYNLRSWANGIRTGKFLKYDYGKKQNQVVYKQKDPVEYDLESLKNCGVPIYLYSGSKDILADPKDVKQLELTLDNCCMDHRITKHYGHLDYTLGSTVKEELYGEIVVTLNQYNGIFD
ncbi:lipase [Anaeramoeba flamelloides]|uniref:Lipase n=1 Tax=Anaeramoeba flamelloides TaxID=1746091 RepID=A0AAV7Z9H7_9EUKA|nr:lipase [Anaeramoeba flamelloides]